MKAFTQSTSRRRDVRPSQRREKERGVWLGDPAKDPGMEDDLRWRLALESVSSGAAGERVVGSLSKMGDQRQELGAAFSEGLYKRARELNRFFQEADDDCQKWEASEEVRRQEIERTPHVFEREHWAFPGEEANKRTRAFEGWLWEGLEAGLLEEAVAVLGDVPWTGLPRFDVIRVLLRSALDEHGLTPREKALGRGGERLSWLVNSEAARPMWRALNDVEENTVPQRASSLYVGNRINVRLLGVELGALICKASRKDSWVPGCRDLPGRLVESLLTQEDRGPDGDYDPLGEMGIQAAKAIAQGLAQLSPRHTAIFRAFSASFWAPLVEQIDFKSRTGRWLLDQHVQYASETGDDEDLNEFACTVWMRLSKTGVEFLESARPGLMQQQLARVGHEDARPWYCVSGLLLLSTLDDASTRAWVGPAFRKQGAPRATKDSTPDLCYWMVAHPDEVRQALEELYANLQRQKLATHLQSVSLQCAPNTGVSECSTATDPRAHGERGRSKRRL